MQTIPDKTLIFDGHCALCHWAVKLVMAIDSNKTIHMGRQAEKHSMLIDTFEIGPDVPANSVLYFSGGEIYFASDAILHLLEDIKPKWFWISFLRRIPVSIRDTIYNWIAQNRYRYYKQKNRCLVTPKEEDWRFDW